MPRGRPPKPADERQRTNSYATHILTWDGVTRGPDLPTNIPGVKWCTVTIAWWEMWRNSPQAMLFEATDWAFLLDTALLHNELWMPKREAVTDKNGKIKRQLTRKNIADLKTIAAEVRQRTEHLGATVRDRQARGIEIKKTQTDKDLIDEAVKKDIKDVHNYIDALTKESARMRENEGDDAP